METGRPAEAGEVRTTLDERVQATRARLRAEGREEGREEARKERLEGQRELLTRQAQQRFGSETADILARHLDVVAEHEQILSVGGWILACSSGSELIDRVKAGL